jgi:RNA polymerase sigma-B factor
VARKPAKFQLSAEQQKLASDNLNLARKEAWRLQRTTGIEYSTLESVAFEGLCKAANRYDPTRPHPVTGKSMKFSSLATPTIRGELLHWIRDKTYSVRLSHKMRENWIKGRKLLYAGSCDLEVAKELGIELTEWLEVRKVCSGPPLELKDQAKPTEPLEPAEMSFDHYYLDVVDQAINRLEEESPDLLNGLDVYLSGLARKIPQEAAIRFTDLCGCTDATWADGLSEEERGNEDLGQGRYQGSLF